MSFLERISQLFGGAQAKQTPELDEIRDALEVARMARRNEDYERATSALDRALYAAEQQQDTVSITVIMLHQSEVFILQGKLDDADRLLQTLLQTTQATNQKINYAYSLCLVGTLHQHRNEWAEARQSYELARDVAIDATAEGAHGRALGHLADTYIHEGNASYGIHLLQESLPKLNASGDLEMSSYFVGRLGEAMLESGQETEGLQLLDRALRLAEQMRDRGQMRRWATALGEVNDDRKAYQQAYQFLKQALTLYEANPTSGYIQTLSRISRTCLHLGEPEEALLYAEQAQQVSASGDDADLTTTAQVSLGIALRALGRDEEALPHLRTAEDYDMPPAERIEVLRNLAAAQDETGHPNEAQVTYQKALDLAVPLDFDAERAQVLRDLGLFYFQQSKPQEAIEHWSEALDLYDSDRQYAQVARLLCDIANARRAMGLGQRAMKDYEKALITLNHVEDLGTRGLVLSNAANAYADQGDAESAQSFFTEAIEIAEKLEDRTAESTRRGNYGWYLIFSGEPRKAIEQLTRALEISKGDPTLALAAAVQTDNLGLAYDALNTYETALDYHQQATALLDALSKASARWRVSFSANLADTLIAMQRTDEAAPLMQGALETAREINEPEVLVGALIGMARLRMKQQDPEAAGTLLSEAVPVARRADMRRLLAEALALQSEQQAAVDNQEKARALWEEAKRLYTHLRAPQAKQTPFWLGTNPPTSTTE